MNFDEYVGCDATALAQKVAQGEVTGEALLELALARHHTVHGRLNAISTLMEAQARAQLAQRPTGPLAGVPFLIKDILQDYAGLPTSAGSRAMLRFVPQVHAHVVRRYLGAGLVVFGKTNLPELALKGVSDSALFGRVSNPWDLERTPGGSSGGAAAAVASGIVPMAAANDGGGSIRIPAAYCGLFGLKPSRGRISNGPGTGDAWFGASTEGVLSRSVRDTALALDLLQGAEPGDPHALAPPSAPYRELMTQDPGKLRVGFTAQSPLGTPVDPEATAAVKGAVELLRSLGHTCEEAPPPVDGVSLAQSYLHMYFGQVGAQAARARAAGATDDDFELLTRVLEVLGKTRSAAQLTAHLLEWNTFARKLGDYLTRFDLLLTPTLAGPALRHGDGDLPRGQAAVLNVLQRTGLLSVLARLGALDATIDSIATENLRAVPFTQLANLTGMPAMSVPLHWSAGGLPVGVQLVAPLGREDRLLQLARTLEAAQPWFHRRPALA